MNEEMNVVTKSTTIVDCNKAGRWEDILRISAHFLENVRTRLNNNTTVRTVTFSFEFEEEEE